MIASLQFNTFYAAIIWPYNWLCSLYWLRIRLDYEISWLWHCTCDRYPRGNYESKNTGMPANAAQSMISHRVNSREYFRARQYVFMFFKFVPSGIKFFLLSTRCEKLLLIAFTDFSVLGVMNRNVYPLLLMLCVSDFVHMSLQVTHAYTQTFVFVCV